MVIVDQCTRSNADEVKIQHLDWDIEVDFEAKTLFASATYSLSEPTCELILDTNNLVIVSVTAQQSKPLSFSLLEQLPGKPHLGRPLVIQTKEPTESITVKYSTTAACSALQWLPPEQTAGKIHPYFYTQCQAIHARSLVPCQDVTSVKFTYTATITTPLWATAVCSALHQSTTATGGYGNQSTAVWNQPVPISSYLLALAVGDLEKRDVSHRCAVYSEPCILDAAAYEFAETETFLATAEKIAGTPYPWTRYDLLCLPPSFSYGGMENPNMTFVTPTLLAGDRSLAGVVAHEIAHSWTGNYVTCATWDDFWLNEGWTVFFERKIVSHGKPAKYLDFAALGGRKSLQDAVNVMDPTFTKLVLPIGDQDPDDAYSVVAYEKGFSFLLYLERLVGKDKFGTFFQDYIKHFGDKTITSDEFRTYTKAYFNDTDCMSAVDWDAWYYANGMPPVEVELDQSLAEDSRSLASAWWRVDREKSAEPDQKSISDWSSSQITCFLDELLTLTQSRPLHKTTVQKMRLKYMLGQTKNSEILLRFCRLAIAAEDETVLPLTVRFITSQGRMKYIRPLYSALHKSKMGKTLAEETFLKHKETYHPIGAKMVASDLLASPTNAPWPTKRILTIVAVIAASSGLVAFALLKKRR